MSGETGIAVIITAAGLSRRMDGAGKKEYRVLPGFFDGAGNPLTVIGASFLAFARFPGLRRIVITHPPGGENSLRQALPPDAFDLAPLILVSGGDTRQESVYRALETIAMQCDNENAPDFLLIHDGARPWVDAALITRVLEAARQYGAAIPLLPLRETPKECAAPLAEAPVFIKNHPRRDHFGAAQTPQGFSWPAILQAHRAAHSAVYKEDSREYTDDAEIWAAYRTEKIMAVPGSAENIKITVPADLPPSPPQEKEYRTGLGRDIHPLAEGRRFLLGGAEIPFPKGEAGHSDGDVLAHAITDALLGAAALGDIGELFPPEDSRWKDADSLALLKTAWGKVRGAGFVLENLDCVVICDTPKILPWREKIRASLAGALEIPVENIFVKGKTNEGFGETGRGLAVEAWAAVLLSRKRSAE